MASSSAQEAPPSKLVIGTREAPPFAMRAEGGRWTGISLELWREIASDLDLQYEVRDYDLQGLLDAVEHREVDAGVAALTVTADREAVMDFSHPFYATGFGIAVTPVQRARGLGLLGRVFTARFLQAAGIIALVLFAFGVLVWLVEHRRNAEQFSNRPAEGIWDGFWWAAVTALVGYGDKVPRTVLGKLIGLVWMFAAAILLAGFIAALSSALTVSQLEAPIRGPEDLVTARVATLKGSTSEAYLRQERIPFQHYPDLPSATQAVADGQVDAVVYDLPLLQYLVNQSFAGKVEILPQTFGRQDYSIALPTGSPLRESINRALLSERIRAAWQDILFRYLQEAPAPPPKP
ncbi:MAG: transporter substrate-binding domain-containing protein [Thermoanaerobaculia bacterium]